MGINYQGSDIQGRSCPCGGYFTDSAELCEAHKRVEASEQSPLGLPGPGQGPLVLRDCLRH